MRKRNIGQDMLRRLQAKIEDAERGPQCGGRVDLNITDYEMLGNGNARVMMEYVAERGVPKQAQVRDWIRSALKGRFKLALSSVKSFQDLNVVTAVVQHQVDPHPIWYADKMIHLGCNRYIDEDKSVWEMKQSDSGDKFLVRTSGGDDVEAILKERTRRQRVGFTPRPTLDMVREATYSKLDTGDKVRYLDTTGMQQIGKITSVGQDTVKIDSQTIDKSLVIDIEEKSPSAEKKEKKELRKIFEQMYGDKGIAEGLTD
jgi:hypothetical protein